MAIPGGETPLRGRHAIILSADPCSLEFSVSSNASTIGAPS